MLRHVKTNCKQLKMLEFRLRNGDKFDEDDLEYVTHLFQNVEIKTIDDRP